MSAWCDDCKRDIKAMMDAFGVPAGASVEQLMFRCDRYRQALELIAAPQRPDGSWNRDRQACRDLADAALDVLDGAA